MPVIEDIILPNDVRILIWNSEAETQVSKKLLSQIKIPDKVTHPQRRQEYLIIRALLDTMGLDSNLLFYDDLGKPAIKGFELSFSHSLPFVAVMRSSGACGVDIQSYSTKVLKIAGKYMNEREQEAFKTRNSSIEFATCLWSCKEALFKKHHTQHYHFAAHLEWMQTDGYEWQFNVGETEKHTETCGVLCKDAYVLAWTR